MGHALHALHASSWFARIARTVPGTGARPTAGHDPARTGRCQPERRQLQAGSRPTTPAAAPAVISTKQPRRRSRRPGTRLLQTDRCGNARRSASTRSEPSSTPGGERPRLGRQARPSAPATSSAWTRPSANRSSLRLRAYARSRQPATSSVSRAGGRSGGCGSTTGACVSRAIPKSASS